MGGGQSVPKEVPAQGPDAYSVYEADGKEKFLLHKDSVATIRYAKSGIAAREADGGAPEATVCDAIKKAAEKWGDKPALRVERPVPALEGKVAPQSKPLSEWKTWTYSEYYNDCRRAAKGFMKLGLERYDGVSILGFNSPEWFMAEIATMLGGGKVSGIYPTDTPAQVQYKTLLADGSIAVVDNKSAFDRFASVVDELPYLKAIVAWDFEGAKDVTRKDGSVVKGLHWEDLLKLGDEGDDAALDARMEATKPGNCACLVFTSGTTGHPKAVMVSHDNLMFEAYVVLKEGIPHFGAEPVQERVISYLPLSHVAGMMVDIISPICCTAYRVGYTTVHFARPYDLKAGSLGDRLRAVRPTLFLGVPRVWEKIAEKIKAVGAKNTGIKKKLSEWAKGNAFYYQKNQLLGGDGSSAWGFSVASGLLGKVKVAIGLEECKFCFSSAAPISKETLEYFASLNININEVYGMSECSGATTWSTDTHHLWESIGYEMPGCEVKIFEVKEDGSKTECPRAKTFAEAKDENKGEVCFRGRHIMMGYLCNPVLGQEHVDEITKKNAETIDNEGFLHSGDMGIKDYGNMFKICGRYKELIITAGGENVAPVPIENELKKNCPAISNAMMVGDKRKFNCCLITLKVVGATGEHAGGDELDGAAKTLGCNTIAEACANEKYIKMITDAITKTNNNGDVCPSNASRIQKFTILPADFSIDGGELTPSLKLKRSVAQEKYSNIIDAIYESSENFVPYSSAPIQQ